MDQNQKQARTGWGLLGVISGWVLGYTLSLGLIGLWVEKKLSFSTGLLSIPLSLLGLSLSFWRIYRYMVVPKEKADPQNKRNP